MKYNYVIFGTHNDYFKIAYSDVIHLKNVRYITKRIDVNNRFILNIYRIHKNKKINSVIPLPFKCFWNKYAFRGKFEDDNPICFMFFEGVEWFNEKYIAYLRKTYKGCKIVAYFQDIIERHYKKERIEKLLALCDLALSYDKGDCDRYNLVLYRDVYSPIDISAADVKSDVCCIIHAKNRLNKIEKAYDVLTQMGLKCDFYVTGVRDKEHVKKEGITYGEKLPYKEVIRRVKASDTILEIMQEGADGYTLRTGEAIAYGKKLLTDNKSVKDEPFYSPDKIFVFDKPEEIKKEFFDGKTVDYKYLEEISPKKLLQYLDDRL